MYTVDTYDVIVIGGGHAGCEAALAAARAAGSWYLLPRLPAVIAAFHLGYGWGTWQGLWDVLRKRPPAQRFARITR